ncbi:lytic murein transglycosylase [Pseudonocardia sp. CA-107938]|uniref:lytic murein transglycosylase n=1 Tax=Pseudonocardia sp. CA-107938 TaxID=3240021 RepID=UPI003D8E327E
MRPVAIVSGVLACVLLAVVTVVAALSAQRPSPGRSDDGLAPAEVARNTPLPQPDPLPAGTDLDAWAVAHTAGTGIPARALRAYAAAEIEQRKATPRCRLSWVTVAGIGRVESDHGRFGSSEIDADGVARPDIVGIPLDGSAGTRHVPDTDGGRLDGDSTYDRAVGPMQFLPATWARYGKGDPQQIDAAARATAAYLCAARRDVSTGRGWWDGVLTYNSSGEYARLVWAAANRYANKPSPQ